MNGSRDYLKLQNGSDIRGVALPGVPGEDVNLDEFAAENIGYAFAKWLDEKINGAGASAPAQNLTVSIGRDPRLSGEKLAGAFAKGLVRAGVTVYDCGLASTPAMFMSTIFDSFICDGAVMITASHLPFNRNGFKFFDKDGGLNKGDIKAILTMAQELENSEESENAGARSGSIDQKDLMDRYCKHLMELICDGIGCSNDEVGNDCCRQTASSVVGKNDATCSNDNNLPLSGLKIVVDAGNGAGGFYADKVLKPLGAEVIGCYLEPDGSFPNHIPNPENKEAMASICGAVNDSGADLGIIFDTDVDRSAAVDENGHEIARNGIVALAAALVGEKHPGTTVVTDSITSDQLNVFLEKDLGMKHLRFKRGYKNVINKAIELNESGEESYLAIETSGHAAIRDNHFLDDGAYLATLIVVKTAKLAQEGKKISSMISSLEEPADATEIRMKLSGEDFGATGDKILSELESWIGTEFDAESNNDQSSDSPAAATSNEKDFSFSLVQPNYEGVRARFTGKDENGKDISGWFLLRKSLHDPIMPLNIESDQEGGCKVIASCLKAFLEKYEALDSGEL